MLFFLLYLTLCCHGAYSFVSVAYANSRHLHCWQAKGKETPSLARPRKPNKRKQESDNDESMRDTSGVNEDLVNRIFVVVDKFGVTEAAIRNALSYFSINSVADLKDVANISLISGGLCVVSGIGEGKTVREALTKEFVDKDRYMMGKLHGMRIFPPGIFTGRLTQETYMKEAASYKVAEPDDDKPDGRPKNVAVVLGPSGAGKSAFSLFGLPDLVFPGQKSLAILLKTSSVTDGKADVQEDAEQFGQALCKLIEAIIKRKAGHTGQRLKCPLLVVLDEAASRGPFDSVTRIELIASHLTDLAEQPPFLVVTGVGMDTVTQHMDSTTDMKKYRMQDWDSEKFQLLIKKWENKEKRDYAMDLVRSYDLLQSMITNARCAAFLVEPMNYFIIPRKTDTNTDFYLIAKLGALLRDVSRRYILTNGLARLSQEQRLKVVRGLFLTLEESLNEPDRAFFPQVPEDLNARETEVWRGFLNINVETQDNETHFVNKNVIGSVSVSQALALVAATILDPEGLNLSTDWLGLEEIAAFGEVKRYLVRKKDFGEYSSNLILRPEMPYPLVRKRNENNLTTAFEFPDVKASGMVVMKNGPGASFADVVAPHRLIQVKQTTTGEIRIDLKEELGKMGCTKDKQYLMQQVYLHYLTHAWNGEVTFEENGAGRNQNGSGQQKRPITQASKVYTPSEFFPFDKFQLTPNTTIPMLMANLSCSSASQESSTSPGCKMVWKIQGGSKMDHTLVEIDPLTDLPCKEPICAVFFTNANTIKVTGLGRTSINRRDVCRFGILIKEGKKKKIESVVKDLLKLYVEVRFLFCS